MILLQRQKIANLSTGNKIYNNLVPSYLKKNHVQFLKYTRSLESDFRAHNRKNYTILKYRLEIYKILFVFYSINKWNS